VHSQLVSNGATPSASFQVKNHRSSRRKIQISFPITPARRARLRTVLIITHDAHESSVAQSAAHCLTATIFGFKQLSKISSTIPLKTALIRLHSIQKHDFTSNQRQSILNFIAQFCFSKIGLGPI
jgi:hypothetical protein